MAPTRIVVANDDPLYLSMIQDLLIEEGYPDVQCVVGADVVPLITREMPDLILLDINFRNAPDTWKKLDILRLQRSTAHIPVIVCSTDGQMLRDKSAWLRGVHCDTLEKPFDIHQLLAKVHAMIGPPEHR